MRTFDYLNLAVYNGKTFRRGVGFGDFQRGAHVYFIAMDIEGVWWHVPYGSTAPDDLRGPYTLEQAIAIARLCS